MPTVVVKSPSLAVKPSSLVSSSPWPEAVEVSGHPQLRAGDAFRVAFALAAQLPQTHFLPAVPSLGLCILSFVLDLRRSPAAPPQLVVVPAHPQLPTIRYQCQHREHADTRGFQTYKRGAGCAVTPSPICSSAPAHPSPTDVLRNLRSPWGLGGRNAGSPSHPHG